MTLKSLIFANRWGPEEVWSNWCGTYSFIYIFIVLGVYCDAPKPWTLNYIAAKVKLYKLVFLTPCCFWEILMCIFFQSFQWRIVRCKVFSYIQKTSKRKYVVPHFRHKNFELINICKRRREKMSLRMFWVYFHISYNHINYFQKL